MFFLELADQGQNYGAQCGAWDEPKCGELWGNTTVGALGGSHVAVVRSCFDVCRNSF